MSEDPEILAVVRTSAPRRWLAVGVQGFLGLLLLWVAGTTPPEVLGWQVFLIVMGLAWLYMANRLRVATEAQLELTADGLRDSTGRVLMPLAQVRRVERGMFAFKPSNGFVVHGTEALGRAWAPGLWWRLGRRVAVGGVTAASETKAMAEIMSALIAQRDGTGGM